MKWNILLLLMLLSSQAVSKDLCPSEKEHDLIIGESEFNTKNALDALQDINQRIPDLIEKSIDYQINAIEKNIKNNEIVNTVHLRMTSVLNSPEFYAGYPNKLSIIRGTILKLEALRLKNNENKKMYERALVKFCDYVKGASYVD